MDLTGLNRHLDNVVEERKKDRKGDRVSQRVLEWERERERLRELSRLEEYEKDRDEEDEQEVETKKSYGTISSAYSMVSTPFTTPALDYAPSACPSISGPTCEYLVLSNCAWADSIFTVNGLPKLSAEPSLHLSGIKQSLKLSLSEPIYDISKSTDLN